MFREHLVISPASTLFQSLHAPAMPVAYKPLSTHDPERDPHTDSPAIPDPNSHSARAKNLLLRLLLLAAVMYAAFRALGSIRPRMRAPCHIAPSHRNLSSLPSHYTLPSGDQIPAIALGTISLSPRLKSTCTDPLAITGVWQADPGQVGAAVKTALKTGYRHIDGAWIYRVSPSSVSSPPRFAVSHARTPGSPRAAERGRGRAGHQGERRPPRPALAHLQGACTAASEACHVTDA